MKPQFMTQLTRQGLSVKQKTKKEQTGEQIRRHAQLCLLNFRSLEDNLSRRNFEVGYMSMKLRRAV